jgi:hypothetical protein
MKFLITNLQKENTAMIIAETIMVIKGALRKI